MNKKIFTGVTLLLAIAVLAGVGGYLIFVKKTNSIVSTIQPAQQMTIETKTSTVSTNPKDDFVDWKDYRDSAIGLSFKYPKSWVVGAYDERPNISVYSALISSLPTSCGEIGVCQKKELSNKKAVEDGSMSGIILFAGGKGSLIATCSGNEGGDLGPTPFYKFKFYKGDRLYEFTLNDLSTMLGSGGDCDSSTYIQSVIKNIPNAIPDPKYKAYNDLLLLIKQTLVLR